MSEPQGIVLGVEPNGRVHFGRCEVYHKIVATRDLTRLLQHEMLFFVHNGVTINVCADSAPEHLLCAWLNSYRTGAAEIGPQTDRLLLEELVGFIQQHARQGR